MPSLILRDLSARPVIAHRGASAEAPENTLAAFHLAAAQHCDAFELDIRRSRDGEAVVMHDPTLDRTCARPGAVAALTLEELRQADAGAGFVAPDGSRPWRGRGVRIPTLREVVRAFPAMPLLIELKVADVQEEVARVLKEEQATARAVVASFRPRALDQLRGSAVQVGADRRDVTLLVLRTRFGLPVPPPRCLLYAVPWRWKDLVDIPHPRFVAAARGHACPVHVWTVDDPDVATRLWQRGVNGIITNRPALMREVRDRR